MDDQNSFSQPSPQKFQSQPDSQVRPSAPSLSAGQTLPNAIDLLGKAWGVYKSRFWILMGISAVSYLLMFFGLVTSGLSYVFILFAKQSPYITVPFLIFFTIIISILNFWVSVSLIFAVKDRGEKIGIKESFKRGWRKIIPFLLTFVLSNLITAIGFVFLIVPGIILGVWFSFAPFYCVENNSVTAALSKSKYLVKEIWWSVFYRLFFIIAISMIGFWLASLVPFGNFFFSLILAPFVLTYNFLLYEDLKKIKSGVTPETPQKGAGIKLIVFAIIGLLTILGIGAAVLFSAFDRNLDIATAKSRDATRKADLMTTLNYLEIYYFENDVYPSDWNTLDNFVVSRGKYLPKDPKTSSQYKYTSLKNGQDFKICADFEDKTRQENCLNSSAQWEAKESISPTPNLVFQEPFVATIEFFPPLVRTNLGYEYESGAVMTIAGGFDDLCVATSPGTGIDTACSKYPTEKKKENGLDVAKFKLNYPNIGDGRGVPFCHRLSDVHEIQFFDNNKKLIKTISCQYLNDFLSN